MNRPSKADLRQAMRTERLQRLPVVQAGIQTVARRQLPGLAGTTGWVGLYWPLRGEVDLRDLGAGLADRLALPVIERAGAPAAPAGTAPGRLLYRPWRRDQPLMADACGIPAPVPEGPPLAASDLTLLLVPALAIDQEGYRLGYGGGWYDRLRSDPAWARIPALAVLPSACRLERLPRDPWDIPLAGWLSEDGLHWCRGEALPTPPRNVASS